MLCTEIYIYLSIYLTLKEPYDEKMGAFGPVWGQRGPFGACRWSKKDKMGPQRPQKELKGLHMAPRLGPTESLGMNSCIFFGIFVEFRFASSSCFPS